MFGLTRDLLAGIRTVRSPTSAGPCELPIVYRDGSAIGLMYLVEPALVGACLPAVAGRAPFEPQLVLGQAVVQFALLEYRDTSIGRYNEVALAAQVRRKGTAPSLVRTLLDLRGVEAQGNCFLNLPVTTEAACAAGRELWGFPKYVVDIETSFAPERVRVVQRGEFELVVGRAGPLVTPGIPFVLLSAHGGRVLRTVVETEHRMRWGGARSVELRLVGHGPTSDNLERLGLAVKKPFAVWRTDALRSVLPAGKDLGAA
ncbi:MAG: acetoacetate decarboxylase family protein [Myxococcales bacterium]|nr:acetoacetate decarboxylase family protein [Myxococcales bacterium]